MRRRDLVRFLIGAAAAWPVVARAQQVRLIAVLMNMAADVPEAPAALSAFKQALQALGWVEGRDVRMDVRWGANDPDLDRQYAAELVALAPDVALASGTLSVVALQRVNRALPIVFIRVSDPVGAGLVDSLAHPGGDTTGFMLTEYSASGKWLELLKEIVPGLRRAAVLRDQSNPAGIAQFGAIQATAQLLGVEVSAISVRDAAQIERAIKSFAAGSNGGLIITGSAEAGRRDLIITLAGRYKLPAVYPFPMDVAGGGLVSYGPDLLDQYRLAAGYVDRILKGENPADLPVQMPSTYVLSVNLKTAKALGIAMPQTVLVRADQVIE